MNQPIRILFVEDDEQMLAIFLEHFGAPEFETRTASNGVEALGVIRGTLGALDIMVTDNYMPGMDGLSLLKLVGQEYPDIRLIMLTAHGNWEDYTQAYNYGAVKFLDKPVRMTELKRVIRNELTNSAGGAK